MDFLKVAHGGKLGDKEAMAPLELEISASLENSQGEGEMKEGVEFRDPHTKSVIEKEMPQEEE